MRNLKIAQKMSTYINFNFFKNIDKSITLNPEKEILSLIKSNIESRSSIKRKDAIPTLFL